MIQLAALAATTLLLGAAPAADPGEATAMADFLTGTLQIENPNGNWSAKRYLAADHTYRETGSDGAVTGTWAIKDGKICTTASQPLGANRIATYCNVGVGKHAGEAWRDEDPVTGNVVLFKLTAGR